MDPQSLWINFTVGLWILVCNAWKKKSQIKHLEIFSDAAAFVLYSLHYMFVSFIMITVITGFINPNATDGFSDCLLREVSQARYRWSIGHNIQMANTTWYLNLSWIQPWFLQSVLLKIDFNCFKYIALFTFLKWKWKIIIAAYVTPTVKTCFWKPHNIKGIPSQAGGSLLKPRIASLPNPFPGRFSLGLCF